MMQGTLSCDRLKASTKVLTTSLIGLILLAGCTFQRPVSIRYTPLVQAQRLVDRTNPAVVVVGAYQDARYSQAVGNQRLNSISVHRLEFTTVGDVPAVVRSAFVDAFLKSGFEVPLEDESGAGPFLQVTGKVLTYAMNIKTGWSTVTMSADVDVEVTLTPRNGESVTFVVQGRNVVEGKVIGYEMVAEILDRALQECVSNFLQHESFLALLKSPSTASAPASLRLPAAAEG